VTIHVTAAAHKGGIKLNISWTVKEHRHRYTLPEYDDEKDKDPCFRKKKRRWPGEQDLIPVQIVNTSTEIWLPVYASFGRSRLAINGNPHDLSGDIMFLYKQTKPVLYMKPNRTINRASAVSTVL